MKNAKRFGSLLLAVLLLLSLGVTALAAEAGYQNAPVVDDDAANSEGPYTITINESMAGHKYTAYQIFSGKLTVKDGKEILTDIGWGNGINEEGQQALIKEFASGIEKATAADVAEAISKSAENAEKVAELLKGHLATGTGLTKGGENYSASVSAGYYLITDEATDEATGDYFVISDYIVQVVGTTTMQPKSDAPGVEKKIVEGDKGMDVADYSIGDTVTFTLTATLPTNYSEYKTYKLVFHDNMSAGLTYGAVSSVTVDGEPLAAEKYAVATGAGDAGATTLTLTIADLKPDGSNGGIVVVTYTATVDTDAVIGNPGNPNTVKLEYSNDPNWDGQGTPPTGNTPEDKVTVFTFELDVNKVAKGEGEENVPLEGAGFTLSKQTAPGEWSQVGDEIKDVTTFEFKGLGEGMYKLEETTVPAGYNSIEPIYFQVKAELDEAGQSVTALTMTHVTENGDPITDITGELKLTFTIDAPTNGTGTTDILNQTGLQLPETGGIGTTIFYVVGGILVVAALVLLVTKKRVKANQ